MTALSSRSKKPIVFSAMDDVEQLYQEIILDHYKHPRNRSDLAPDEVLAEEDNPLCGDQLRMTAALDEGRISAIRYDGKGCAISQASASMMSEALQGKTVEEARQLIQSFVSAMRGEAELGPEIPEELLALSGVKKFPLRIKCATLAWHGMEKVLKTLSGSQQDNKNQK